MPIRGVSSPSLVAADSQLYSEKKQHSLGLRSLYPRCLCSAFAWTLDCAGDQTERSALDSGLGGQCNSASNAFSCLTQGTKVKDSRVSGKKQNPLFFPNISAKALSRLTQGLVRSICPLPMLSARTVNSFQVILIQDFLQMQYPCWSKIHSPDWAVQKMEKRMKLTHWTSFRENTQDREFFKA